MEIFKSHIHAYAGCGITKLSNPNKEWQETENKLQTLLKHLT
jgi:isochorismate synthase